MNRLWEAASFAARSPSDVRVCVCVSERQQVSITRVRRASRAGDPGGETLQKSPAGLDPDVEIWR